jgi:hypothetical protein
MSEAYGKNINKIQTGKGIGFTFARSVSDVMYNYLRFQQYRYFDSSGLKVQEELYSQLLHVPFFTDEKLNDLSSSIQPLDRKEKKGIVPLSNVTSPRSSPKLGTLFGMNKPKKISSVRVASPSMARAPPRGRSSSIGDNDSE